MTMNELHLLNIDHGTVPVVVSEKNFNGKTFYEGRMFEGDGIYIVADTKEDCLKKLKNAIDTGLKFWLRLQISDLGIFIRKD